MSRSYKLFEVRKPNADRSEYDVHYWLEIAGVYYGKLLKAEPKTISKVMGMIEKGKINGLIGIPFDSVFIKQV